LGECVCETWEVGTGEQEELCWETKFISIEWTQLSMHKWDIEPMLVTLKFGRKTYNW